jgi:hypothetical protein
MKKLIYNNEQYTAERIVRTDKNIIGYNGDNEVFAFRGISDFSQFELEDGQEFDMDEKEEMVQRISDLELYILTQEGLI